MPTVSRFREIDIKRYGNDHDPPHFHALHDGEGTEMKVAIDPVALIESDADRRSERLVLDWAKAHRNELLENWHRLRRGEATVRIDPA